MRSGSYYPVSKPKHVQITMLFIKMCSIFSDSVNEIPCGFQTIYFFHEVRSLTHLFVVFSVYKTPAMFSIKISSPTCEELGIPRDHDDQPCVQVFQTAAHVIKNPSLHIDGLRYEAALCGVSRKRDPFSPLCIIPLPSAIAEQGEPSCIGKRNERERERVRCVNDGYARLREHLPLERKDKRISKVDTLRKAIDYIKHLEKILAHSVDDVKPETLAGNDPIGSPKSHSGEELCAGFSDTDSSVTDGSDLYHKRRSLDITNVVDSHSPCSEKRKCVHNA